LANPEVVFDALLASTRNASDVEGPARLTAQRPCGQVRAEDHGYIRGKGKSSTPDKAEPALPRIPPRAPDQTHQFLSEKTPDDQCRCDQGGRDHQHVVGRCCFVFPIRVVTHARSMHRRRTLAPNGYNSGLGFAHPDPPRQVDAKAMGALQSGLKLTCIGTFHRCE